MVDGITLREVNMLTHVYRRQTKKEALMGPNPGGDRAPKSWRQGKGIADALDEHQASAVGLQRVE